MGSEMCIRDSYMGSGGRSCVRCGEEYSGIPVYSAGTGRTLADIIKEKL